MLICACSASACWGPGAVTRRPLLTFVRCLAGDVVRLVHFSVIYCPVMDRFPLEHNQFDSSEPVPESVDLHSAAWSETEAVVNSASTAESTGYTRVALGPRRRLVPRASASEVGEILSAADVLQQLEQRRSVQLASVQRLEGEVARETARLTSLRRERECLEPELERLRALAMDARVELSGRQLPLPEQSWGAHQLGEALLHVAAELGRAWGETLEDDGSLARVLERTLGMYLSLAQGRMALLQGDPGAGKTSLVTGFGAAMGMKVYRLEVSRGWNDPAEVIGSVQHTLRGAQFVAGPLGDALLRASVQSQASVILLDEINITTPEHGLSTVMSVMAEDGERQLQLCAPDEAAQLPESLLRERAGTLSWPPFVLMAASMNEARTDSTVRPISPRLRDRCAVLELTTPPSSPQQALRRLRLRGSLPAPARLLSGAVWQQWTDPAQTGVSEELALWAAGRFDQLASAARATGVTLMSTRAELDALLLFSLAWRALEAIERHDPGRAAAARGGATLEDAALSLAARLTYLPRCLDFYRSDGPVNWDEVRVALPADTHQWLDERLRGAE